MCRIEIVNLQNNISLNKQALLKFLPNIGHTITLENKKYVVKTINHDILCAESDEYANIYVGVLPIDETLNDYGELKCQ